MQATKRVMVRLWLAVLVALALLAAGCGDDDGGGVVAEEPAADEPAADEPAADEPAADEPAADEPAADEPAADEPAADEPMKMRRVPRRVARSCMARPLIRRACRC